MRRVEQTAPTWTSPTTRTWLLRSSHETGGELFEQRVEYAPGSPFPPTHFHPAQSELFEVESGAMIYVVDGTQRRLAAGQTLELPPGTPHKARNASATETAVVRWETRPALRAEDFHRTAATLGAAGPLDSALLAHTYRAEFRATGLLGLVIPAVAALARLLGRSLPDVEHGDAGHAGG